MTDEKKKPEEDEVSDEQLEDVAGGGIAGPGSAGLGSECLPVTGDVVTRLPGRSEILVPSASTEDVESPPDLFGKASL